MRPGAAEADVPGAGRGRTRRQGGGGGSPGKTTGCKRVWGGRGGSCGNPALPRGSGGVPGPSARLSRPQPTLEGTIAPRTGTARRHRRLQTRPPAPGSGGHALLRRHFAARPGGQGLGGEAGRAAPAGPQLPCPTPGRSGGEPPRRTGGRNGRKGGPGRSTDRRCPRQRSASSASTGAGRSGWPGQGTGHDWGH